MPTDLRSDTVTRPTPAMRQAMAEAEVGDDVLDGDPTVRRLEAQTAALLGKERALFFPTGSMANQVAIMLQAPPGTEALCDAAAHVIQWEMGAMAAICGVQPRGVSATRLVMDAHDLRAGARPPSRFAPAASLVCLENTHNGAGGKVTSLEGMQQLRAVAGDLGLPVHLDGARLWNASAAPIGAPSPLEKETMTVSAGAASTASGSPVAAAAFQSRAPSM